MKQTSECTQRKDGQVLLITVMLIATVITVVMSASFKAATDTQTTQAQSESQKALAAAESAIEAQLKSAQPGQTTDINSISGIPPGLFTGTVTISATKAVYFATPLIQRDGQYTFYLADYKAGGANYWTTPPVFSNPDVYTGALDVYYGTTATSGSYSGCAANDMALDIILIGTGGQIRSIADYNHIADATDTGLASNSSTTQDGVTYYCKASIGNIAAQAPNARILAVRVIAPSSQSTRLLFKAADGTTVLPLQGKYVTSTVSTLSTGLTKKVQLFQSYPQIPADMMVTSF